MTVSSEAISFISRAFLVLLKPSAVAASTTRSPFSIPLFLLLQALILLGYALRPSRYRSLLFIPVSFITYYLVLYTTAGTIADVGLGNALANYLLSAFDRIVVTDIQKTLHRVGERPGQIISAPFMQRLAWSFHLHCSPRGIGWSFEPSHILRNRPSINSRTAFLLSRLFTLLLCAGILWIFRAVNAVNPALAPGAIPLYKQSLYVRVLCMLSLGIPGLVHINFQHCLMSILMVGLGISVPADWPPLFGSLLDMYSVQSFWRNVWHQMLRSLLLSTANFMIHTVLHLPRKSSLSIGLLKLHTVFLVSGLLHYAGEFMMLGYGGSGALYFFILQAWAITLEVVVRYLITGSTRASASNKPMPIMWYILGYAWVFYWFMVVTPLMQQPMVEAGVFLGPSDSALARMASRWFHTLDVI